MQNSAIGRNLFIIKSGFKFQSLQYRGKLYKILLKLELTTATVFSRPIPSPEMKTLICSSPGHFDYIDSAVPELTKDHAIIRIKRIGVCGTDLHAFEGTQPYFRYPRILGHELAAEIETVDGTSDFRKGEMVTIIPYFYCGKCIACRNGKPNCCVDLRVFGVHIDGGMTEYVSVPSYSLVGSQGLNKDSLALIEPLAIGTHAVKRAAIQPGENVLVIGAGPIGLGTMEMVRIAGGNVIALDINESRLAFCREKLKSGIPLTALFPT